MVGNTFNKESTPNNNNQQNEDKNLNKNSYNYNILKPFEENKSNYYSNQLIKPKNKTQNNNNQTSNYYNEDTVHNYNILKPFDENKYQNYNNNKDLDYNKQLNDFYKLSTNSKDNLAETNNNESIVKNEMNDDSCTNVKNESKLESQGKNGYDIDLKKGKVDHEAKKLFYDISKIVNSFSKKEIWEILSKQNFVLPCERNFLMTHLNYIIEGKVKLFKYSDLVPNYKSIAQLGKFITHAKSKNNEEIYHKPHLIKDILQHPNNVYILDQKPFTSLNTGFYILIMIKLNPNKFDSLVDSLQLYKSLFFRKVFNLEGDDVVMTNLQRKIFNLNDEDEDRPAAKINNSFVNLLITEKKKKFQDLTSYRQRNRTDINKFGYSERLENNKEAIEDMRLKRQLERLEAYPKTKGQNISSNEDMKLKRQLERLEAQHKSKGQNESSNEDMKLKRQLESLEAQRKSTDKNVKIENSKY